MRHALNLEREMSRKGELLQTWQDPGPELASTFFLSLSRDNYLRRDEGFRRRVVACGWLECAEGAVYSCSGQIQKEVPVPVQRLLSTRQ